MTWIVIKYLLTAAIVVLISEVAKRSDKLGALLTALPLVAILALIWMQLERQPPERMATYASQTFWYVLPTLPMFLIFPLLLPRLGFWPALLICMLVTAAGIALLALFLRRFGVELL